jgi:hypothetical protein
MGTLGLDSLGRYDSVYLSAQGRDVTLACAARVQAERARGQSVLVVALFAAEDETASGVLRSWGADFATAGLPPAAQRRATASLGAARFDRTPPDEEALQALVRLLTDLGPRTRARHVYAPLAVGGHIDHRLTHEAALRAMVGEIGRNLFLYEERPEAFVPGAVRVRLGLLGARLPPGAADAAEGAGLARYLARVHVPPAVRGELTGWTDRVRSLGSAAGEWRAARAWNPQRALGPRFQPVVHSADASTRSKVEETWAQILPQNGKRARSPERLKAALLAYARKLGAPDYAERYWLVLPALDRATEPATADAGFEAAGVR